ncbi:serine hydrolase domain-containing protein [Deinococcus maricopensis]|uniref:Beta-lactamase n=1 Tax=Deinococcus maricopensis (strain DSM 21211 / LMG 22137 / NRRL B-23946 / LB-34) TaxID=709986 RepID=E8UBD7_DEIML|nr:serine hydrolase domain-containing protein [Deinococcus maricopensis]ADV68376.1 beta-lactamase [Deinococcus maricopensis DSM 21211]
MTHQGHPHDLPVVPPHTVGLDPQRLEQAERHLTAQRPHATSLLVARHGQLAFERYFGIQAHEAQDTQSITKSLVSLLTGVVVRRGLLHLDQPILQDWPDAQRTLTDPRWHAVTVRHLLTMTSGLPSEITNPAYDDAWFLNADPVHFTLTQTLRTEPGTEFHYSNAGVHLLGTLLARVTGQPLERVLQDTLLSPLGIPARPWPRDPQGRVWASGMLHLTPRELLRLGQLVLQEGQWQGHTLVPARWIKHMTRPWVEGYAFMEGLPRYGWLWWLPGPPEPPGLYATGYGGQYLAVFPDLELVVVMTGRVEPHPSHRHVIADLAAHVASSPRRPDP